MSQDSSNLKSWEKALVAGPLIAIVGLAALIWIAPAASGLVDKEGLSATTQARRYERGTAEIQIARDTYECPRSYLVLEDAQPPVVHYDPAWPSRCRGADVLDRPNLGEIFMGLWGISFLLLGLASTAWSVLRFLWRLLVG